MLGTFTLAELLPELKEFVQAKASSKAVFEIIDQVPKPLVHCTLDYNCFVIFNKVHYLVISYNTIGV